MLDKEQVNMLQSFAKQIRIKTIHQMKVRGFGHIGGAMSIVDVLSVLYGKQMKYDPKNPAMEDRDWIVCSKGHAGPAIYAALALKGFFPMEWLDPLNQSGTNLPSHCDRKKTPGIDVTTGSLGQGLSVACGIALGKKQNHEENTIYCFIGDGESQEGQNWEAIMFAAQQKLDNLILFLDDNKMQLDDMTAAIENMESYSEKFKSFHWDVQEIDGHDYEAIDAAIDKAKSEKGKPSVIVLHTIKGKGCKFAEEMWNHHVSVSEEQANEAIAILEK